jgi:hypothetical protein
MSTRYTLKADGTFYGDFPTLESAEREARKMTGLMIDIHMHHVASVTDKTYTTQDGILVGRIG